MSINYIEMPLILFYNYFICSIMSAYGKIYLPQAVKGEYKCPET